MTDTSRTRSVGRPSVVEERRAQIIDAFIDLVGESQSVDVSVVDVARRAGVARTAVAHFIGDRQALLAAAVAELQDRYQRTLDLALGPDPSPDTYIDVLFSADWALQRDNDDRAFDTIVAHARGEDSSRQVVRATFQHFLDALTDSIAAHHPSLDDPRGRAWAIICLSEFTITLLELGFDADDNRRARTAARRLLT
ncbi:hypothetical protein [Euzebya tangerina]|uniref:hypothetical protein n=1 Tax=Euzebya tangerina TaxID=591198 RepID=UPI000E31FA81|nr:hypothetical protein [Euzebya tangerina]